MAPFGFLKKKDSPQKEPEDAAGRIASGSGFESNPSEQIPISRAQDLLRDLELEKVRRLSVQLEPVKTAVEASLSNLAAIAKEMENEEIKLEGLEQRHRSVIENSRKTVVASLKREAATELTLPATANDAKKFRERMESLMRRFGEVSGSHSKLLNVFLKKHAARMKREFERLEEQLSITRSAVSELEQDRAPIIRCTSLLNSASQMIPSLAAMESSIADLRALASDLESQIESTRIALDALQSSDAYRRAQVSLANMSELEQKKKENENSADKLFSHISRLLTKYSYGVDKETNRLLTIMIEEPSQVFESDAGPFLILLSNVRSSLVTGNITVKDGEKMVGYLETLVNTLPSLHQRNREIAALLDGLAREDELQAASQARSLERALSDQQERLSSTRQSIELQSRQLTLKKGEVVALLAEAESVIFSLTSPKKYAIRDS
ncbi:MAG: hypothetical protein ABI361_03895 [Nitrososphaera sp.]